MKLSKLDNDILLVLEDKELSVLQIQKELEKDLNFNSFWGLRIIHPEVFRLIALQFVASPMRLEDLGLVKG